MKDLLAHTWADCVYEWRSTRGLRRGLVMITSALALLRLLAVAGPFGGRPLRNLLHDARFAFRRLRQSPIFVLFAVTTLALSIGAATAVYSVVYAVAYKPPAIDEVERIVNVYHTPAGSGPRIAFAWLDFADLKARQTHFLHLAGWSRFTNAIVTDDGTRPFHGELVDGDYFSVLRVRPQLGRLIQPADDEASATPVIVLSDHLWRAAFAADPSVIGRVVTIGGEEFTVIGVAPQDARGVDSPSLSAPALWLPMRQRQRVALPGYLAFRDDTDRNNRWVRGVGRLRDGVTMEAAGAELRQIGESLDQAARNGLDSPSRTGSDASRNWSLKRLIDIRIHESMAAVVGPVVTTVLVSVVLVLLVASTNLANLLLARGASRRQEFAMRMALGASRARLMREQLVECGVLALAGGLLGALVARSLTVLLSADFAIGDGVQMVLSVRPELNLPVLMMAIGATLLALLTFGVLPAWYSTDGDIRSVLASDTSGGVLPRWRGRRMLIGTQVTVSVALLAVTAVCVGNAVRLGQSDPGFALEELALVTTEPGLGKLDGATALGSLESVRERVSRLSGVTGVAIATSLPVGSGSGNVSMAALAQPATRIWLKSVTASAGYLTTIGVPILEGRDLSTDDIASRETAVVLSARAADRLFQRRSVVGQLVTFTRQVTADEGPSPIYTARIVGVVEDAVDSSSRNPREGTAYLSLGQHPARELTLIARTTADASLLAGQLRSAVSEADSRLPITRVSTGLEIADGFTVLLRVVAGTAGILGAFALLLAVIGLYGVLSFVVARRSREIGVRIALGAERRSVSRLIVSDGLKPVLWGLLSGTLLAGPVLLNPLSMRMLSSSGASLAFALAAPALMLVASLLAAYAPARRAARVDPNVALRQQ